MRVLILIEDNPDGTVNVSVASSPPMTERIAQSRAELLGRLLEYEIRNLTEKAHAGRKRPKSSIGRRQ